MGDLKPGSMIAEAIQQRFLQLVEEDIERCRVILAAEGWNTPVARARRRAATWRWATIEADPEAWPRILPELLANDEENGEPLLREVIQEMPHLLIRAADEIFADLVAGTITAVGLSEPLDEGDEGLVPLPPKAMKLRAFRVFREGSRVQALPFPGAPAGRAYAGVKLCENKSGESAAQQPPEADTPPPQRPATEHALKKFIDGFVAEQKKCGGSTTQRAAVKAAEAAGINASRERIIKALRPHGTSTPGRKKLRG